MSIVPAGSKGPIIVDGTPATVYLIEYKDLATSPFLESIFNVVNAAFAHAHPPYIGSVFRRLLSPEQILKELKPGSFTYAVTIPKHPSASPAAAAAPDSGDAQPPVIIAVGSIAPSFQHTSKEIIADPGDDARARFTGTIDRSHAARRPLPGVVDWEPKQVCVLPEYMKRGLAGTLLSMMEEEVTRRVAAAAVTAAAAADRASGGTDGAGAGPGSEGGSVAQKTPGGIRMMISTIREMNGVWYERKGYRMIEKSAYPAGTMGGTAPFEIWHMDKRL